MHGYNTDSIDEAWIESKVRELTAIDRPSASHGEHMAAKIIRDHFSRHGLKAAIETERAHGGYWKPLGILSGLGLGVACMGLTRSRKARWTGLIGGAAAYAVWDDVTAGSQFFRKLLPRRDTYNVVAEVGPSDAENTVLVMAHHDAAHSGLIFNPKIPQAAARLVPGLFAKSKSSPPVMAPVFLAPLVSGLGTLLGIRPLTKFGAVLSGALVGIFTDIGLRKTVPGANDNVSGVVSLMALASILSHNPPKNVRVMLLSTGSEESLMEGMHGFAKRHFPSLPKDSTFALCIETIGSGKLTALAGEGMLKMYQYSDKAITLLKSVCEERGIDIMCDLKLRNSTDGLYALKAGYTSAVLGSVDDNYLPSNYHWPSDIPENLDYECIQQAIEVEEAVIRKLDCQWSL